MSEPAYRALIVDPLAQLLREAHAEGKLDDDALDLGLTAGARAWVDGVCEASGENAAADVESLIGLVAAQRGGETGLRELAETIAARWRGRAPFDALERAAAGLVDGPGFVLAQAAEWLVVDCRWTYQGGRSAFSLSLGGLATASEAMRTFVGALLVALARAVVGADLDVQLVRAAGDTLCVTGRVGRAGACASTPDPAADARLHRAVLA